MFEFVRRARQFMPGGRQELGSYGQLKILDPTNPDLDPQFLRASGIQPPQPTTATQSVLGLDLGQTNDPSAGVMLERRSTSAEGPQDPRLHCRWLREWPKGTDYGQVINDVLDLNPNIIAPEFNGVGRPVVDELRRVAAFRGYKGTIIPVVSVCSNAKIELHMETRGKHITVPKSDLISAISILQQKKLLRFLACPKKSCPTKCGCDVNKLLKELADFQKRMPSHRAEQYGNVMKAGAHDDLVIALAISAWISQRFGWRGTRSAVMI